MGSIFGADQPSIRDSRIFVTARQFMHMSIVFTATGRVLRLHGQRTLHLEPPMTGTSGNDRDKQAVEQLPYRYSQIPEPKISNGRSANKDREISGKRALVQNMARLYLQRKVLSGKNMEGQLTMTGRSRQADPAARHGVALLQCSVLQGPLKKNSRAEQQCVECSNLSNGIPRQREHISNCKSLERAFAITTPDTRS